MLIKALKYIQIVTELQKDKKKKMYVILIGHSGNQSYVVVRCIAIHLCL